MASSCFNAIYDERVYYCASGETSAGEYVPPHIKRLHYPAASTFGRNNSRRFRINFCGGIDPRDDLISAASVTAISAESIRGRDNKAERARGAYRAGCVIVCYQTTYRYLPCSNLRGVFIRKLGRAFVILSPKRHRNGDTGKSSR